MQDEMDIRTNGFVLEAVHRHHLLFYGGGYGGSVHDQHGVHHPTNERDSTGRQELLLPPLGYEQVYFGKFGNPFGYKRERGAYGQKIDLRA